MGDPKSIHVLRAGADSFLWFFDVESCPEEMTKCGGKRGRSGGREQTIKMSDRQAGAQGAISKRRPPLLLVAVMIAWLTGSRVGVIMCRGRSPMTNSHRKQMCSRVREPTEKFLQVTDAPSFLEHVR